MDYLEIEGGSPLCGEVCIQGSKNAALPILSAAVLNHGITVLKNCPKIIDVKNMLEILIGFGCKVNWEGDTLIIDATVMNSNQVAACYARQMRSSIMLLGSLLGRTGTATLPYPGGCVIGERPIDLHIEALRKMGAELEEKGEGLCACCKKPQSSRVCLPFPSVGATENVILLAVLAKGVTILNNAAREPEIEELCRFLNCMGAKIQGAGTSQITITGVETLHDVEFTIVSDRIVAGTYMLMTAAVGGRVILNNPPLQQLGAVYGALRCMGVHCKECGEHLLLWRTERMKGLKGIRTEPYPGFPTDLQSPLMAALALADGESEIEETIFEARFKIVEELLRMGADICTEGQKAYIRGVRKLYGADLIAKELRGGAALVLAAAAAEGKSRILQYHYIERGYENIIRDLQSLGVMVKKNIG